MDIAASPTLPEPEEIHALVVYDRKTGRIVHRHHVVRYPGAPRRTREELDARAMEVARARTGARMALGVLHVDWQAFTEAAEFRVDARRKRLVRGRVFADRLTRQPGRARRKR